MAGNNKELTSKNVYKKTATHQYDVISKYKGW